MVMFIRTVRLKKKREAACKLVASNQFRYDYFQLSPCSFDMKPNGSTRTSPLIPHSRNSYHPVSKQSLIDRISFIECIGECTICFQNEDYYKCSSNQKRNKSTVLILKNEPFSEQTLDLPTSCFYCWGVEGSRQSLSFDGDVSAAGAELHPSSPNHSLLCVSSLSDPAILQTCHLLNVRK